MKPLLEELRFEILKVIVLNAFLDSVLFFLAMLLVLSVFGIGLFFPLVLSLLFFLLAAVRQYRKYSLRQIEDRNPVIREMLRTASDNQAEETLMAHALFAEVIARMKRVSSGSFLNFQRIIGKIAAMFGLSLVLVSLAYFNVNIQKYDNPLPAVRDRLGSMFGGALGGYLQDDTGPLSDDGDIYGQVSIAKLGEQELDITLHQNLNQIDFSSVSEADPREASLRDYPVEVGAQASQAYTEGLEDVNDRKTAAEYSQEIKR